MSEFGPILSDDLTPMDPRQTLAKLAQLQPDETVLLFVGEDSANDLENLLVEFRQRSISCAGAIFPEVIVGTETFTSGFVATRISSSYKPCLFEISNEREYGFDQVEFANNRNQLGTVVVFADSNSHNVPGFLSELYRHFGSRWQYFGAGAGLLDGTQTPCVFSTESGIKQDAVMLAFISGDGVVNSSHGWTRAVGPVVATKSEGNLIHRLNWRPAFEVYRELVRGITDKSIDAGSIDEIGVGFPLGMTREGAEDLVRLPLGVEEGGALVVIGGIPNNSVLHVLSGDEDGLVEATRKNAAICAGAVKKSAVHKIVLDCVTRHEFLGDHFGRELAAIESELKVVSDKPLIGALARGEIATSSGGYPEWLNKTTVVGAFE